MKIRYYYVYILRCSDNTFYTGFSNNPYKRLDEHNAGIHFKSYTFLRRPLELVYTEAFTDPVEGIAFEKQLKGWSRKKKELLIAGKRNQLPLLNKKQASASSA